MHPPCTDKHEINHLFLLINPCGIWATWHRITLYPCNYWFIPAISPKAVPNAILNSWLQGKIKMTIIVKKQLLPSVLVLLTVFLTGCSGIETDPTYGNKVHDETYKNGSVVSDEGGFSLFGDTANKRTESAGIGVNAFLWRASLDTVSFMPILSADPFGGVIITDWYASPQDPSQRTKLNVFIRDRDLRADGVKVSVFRQNKDQSGNWSDAAVSPITATELENAILTKARQIRMAQKQFQ